LAGGSEGVQRGLALPTPSEGPRKALGTPYQPISDDEEKKNENLTG